MEKRKRAKLRAAGWTVGTPREFLRLSDEEVAFVEFKARSEQAAASVACGPGVVAS